MAEANVDSNAPDPEGETGASSEWTALEVSLPSFEGPLDLLLHLVRSQGLDILDLPVALVARQYNEYLDAMRRLDLELASEYLVMASTLALIKSRMMLPADPTEDEAEDPRQELVDQLLEYEKYRKAAETLGEIDSSRDLIFVRAGSPPPELAGEVTLRVDLDDLVQAFRRILGKLEEGDLNLVIRRDDFRMQDMMERIVSRIEAARTLSFSTLLSECRNRLERVVLFLGLLELIRLGSVAAHQGGWRDEIRIESTPASGQGTP